MPTIDASIAALAFPQHGLVARDQATAAGLSPDQITYRLATGRWMPLAPNVYLIAGAPISWETKVHAACLSCGGVASHRCGATLLDARGFKPGRVEITVPRGTRVQRLDARVHESTDLDRARIIHINGIPVTAPDRLAVDLGGVVPFRMFKEGIEDLIAVGKLSWDEALSALVRHARRGRRGVGALRALIEDRYGVEIPQSVLERVMDEILRDAGLPRPELQYEIFDDQGFIARVDFAYPDQKVLIEVDGIRWHGTSAAFEADPMKRNRLELAGWTVLVFTWKRLLREPQVAAHEVRRALRGVPAR